MITYLCKAWKKLNRPLCGYTLNALSARNYDLFRLLLGDMVSIQDKLCYSVSKEKSNNICGECLISYRNTMLTPTHMPYNGICHSVNDVQCYSSKLPTARENAKYQINSSRKCKNFMRQSFSYSKYHYFNSLRKPNYCYTSANVLSNSSTILPNQSKVFLYPGSAQCLHTSSAYFHPPDVPDYLIGNINKVVCAEEEEEELNSTNNEMEEEIAEFLTCRAIAYDETDSSFIVQCPTCSGMRGMTHHTRDIFIDKHTGYYVCPWCCGAGSWLELCQVLDARQDTLSRAQLEAVLEATQLVTEEFAATLTSVPFRNLSISTLQEYGCRVSSDGNRLVVPVWQKVAACVCNSHSHHQCHQQKPQDQQSYCSCLKTVGYYSVSLLYANSKVVSRFLKGHTSAWSSLTPHSSRISPDRVVAVSHICEALYLAQLGIPVITVPNGIQEFQEAAHRAGGRISASETIATTVDSTESTAVHHSSDQNDDSADTTTDCLPTANSSVQFDNRLVPDVWGLVPSVRRVVLWFTKTGGPLYRFYLHLARNIGCSAVSPPGKTPLYELTEDQIHKGLSGTLLLLESDKVTSIANLHEQVFERITRPEEVRGVPWKRFTELQRLMLGHRGGEVTVLSGPTGSGKTTLMAEYSLDLAMQGVVTLWLSLEVAVVRLCEVLLQQYAGVPLPTQRTLFSALAQHFQQVPLYFLDLHGQQDLHTVMQMLRESVLLRGVNHVVVDNLQFLVGCQDTAAERWLQQDRAMAAFRTFATQHGVHVTLIVHPRKLKTGEVLSVQTIGGGARVVQEADNVLLLQVQGENPATCRKAIEVVKNRYGGHLGVVPLKFHADSLTLSNCFKRVKSERRRRSGGSSSRTLADGVIPAGRDFKEEWS